MDITKNEMWAYGFGVFIGGLVTLQLMGNLFPTGNNDHHPIGYTDSKEEVHVHSDFILSINGQQYDFSDDKYQSKTSHILHAHIHLHDHDGDVIHRHDYGVTLGQFFDSLGFTLTDDCITTDTEETFCSDETNELMVFVNDERIENPADYINEEEDQILIYFGDKDDSETITNLLLEITDQSCIYSGTCPERGTAPPESCGLTCEL